MVVHRADDVIALHGQVVHDNTRPPHTQSRGSLLHDTGLAILNLVRHARAEHNDKLQDREREAGVGVNGGPLI